jgi:putative transcriptional regulator
MLRDFGRAALVLVALLSPVRPLLAQTQVEPVAGELLVAAPGIDDPRFADTVVYVVHHDRDGAFGIVVNRPAGTKRVAELLESIGQDARGVTGSVPIFQGGPVQTELGFVLHTADYHDAMTLQVDDKFAVTSDSNILRDIAAGKGPKRSLVAFGYTGWGPGQLDDELGHNAWYVAPADGDLLFDGDRDSVWDRAFQRRTLRL